MKLVVLTPVVKRSAIGRSAALTVRALKSSHDEITVIRTESTAQQGEDKHDFGVKIVSWQDTARCDKLLRQADGIIYQIGNHFPYHEGACHWSVIHPGTVCLHDFYLGHLFHGWAQTRREEADRLLRSWYGDDIADRFFNFASSEEFIDFTSEVAPMTEWVSSCSQGVITHSTWGCGRVLRACPGPVWVAPLPYDAAETSIGASTPTPRDGQVRLLTIGHVNPNKRVESVIKAIGSRPELRKRISYQLVGSITPDIATKLMELASDQGVDLLISGEVDDARLARIIMECHLVSCLRWPTLEAASASAIEAMLYGKPILCTQAGFYLDIPEDCAFKIPVDEEIDSISTCLSMSLDDPARLDGMGAHAREWARQTFSAPAYAEALREMVLLTWKARPVIAACQSFAALMLGWSSGKPCQLDPVDMQALEIFGSNTPTPDFHQSSP